MRLLEKQVYWLRVWAFAGLVIALGVGILYAAMRVKA